MPSTSQAVFVAGAPISASPPPPAHAGAIGWLRANLFSSLSNTALTVIFALLVLWTAWTLAKFLLLDAVWSGADREACLASAERPVVGACWAFVRERLNFCIYGFYPVDQRWRVDFFFAALAFGIAWLTWLDAPRRGLSLVYFFVILPVVSFALLRGLPAFGLQIVPTAQWGGVLVTIVVAAVGIVVSLPLGILLALGRRSVMPIVRLISVIYIEFVRGVPLITVLFMASVMLPLFVPDTWSPDKLLRALVGVALFSAAYMAEVVRAGLQAIPRGQYEAAMAVGLSYWKSMCLVVLPQALKITIPNMVNSAIGLFKDTTLVFVVGIFDLLKTVEAARIDPQWATPVTSTTGYVFVALFYFAGCYGMSRYASYVEKRLAQGERQTV
jgi:general L-amino acid transport system permease protein